MSIKRERNAVLLEEIAAPARLLGIIPGYPVTVLAVQMHGENAAEVTYRDDDGALGQVVLFRDDEQKILPHHGCGRPFDADARDFRLAAEAQRIMLAGLHDPMLAVATSDVQPLPHQIRAVYGELLPRTHCGSCSPTILARERPSWQGFTSRS